MINIFHSEIIDYIKQNKGAETAELQKKFGISYKDAKLIVAELLSTGDLVYVGGVKYSYVGKSETPYYEPRKVEPSPSKHGYEGISSAAERLAMLQARRNELLANMREEGDDDEDPDSVFEDIENLCREDDKNSDGEFDDFEADFQEQSRRLEDIVNRALDKHAPISQHVMPSHSFWEDDKEFMEVLMERFERLIKSDMKMGQQGAVKKAEAYLEAVRDTNDFKMIQVYERVVYEMKNISPRIYRQLKKRLCEE